MTCLEKLKKEHPDDIATESGFPFFCPKEYGYKSSYNRCVDSTDCYKCWDGECIESTEETSVSDESYNPIQKAYDLMVGFCHEGKTTDLEKVIGYLGEALDEHPEDSIEKVIADDSEPHIKDSGDRTRFESGAVRDMREGKGRCDLMPLEVAARVLNRTNSLDDIGLFLKTGNTDHLYFALRVFASSLNGPEDMLLEVAKHFEEGAKKYGENNWQKGIPVHCYIDSAVRHYLKWLRGDKDEPHDRAFVWNLMCCIWEVDYHKKEDEE